jgi:predicted amidohydrolase YtcJ
MATTVLTGTTVITMDPDRPRAEAVAIQGSRIAAVGTAAEVRGSIAGRFEEVDLGGGALLPGFIDVHNHASQAGFIAGSTRVSLPVDAPVAALLEQVEAEAKRDPDTPWVRLQGYDHHKLRERRAPTREELDEVVPDRPVLLIAASFHEAVLNSRGFRELGWDAATPDPPNGFVARDGDGRPTGEIAEGALYLADAATRGVLIERAGDAFLDHLEAHLKRLLAAGITRIADAAVPPEFEAAYQRAADRDRLPITVHRMPVASSILSPRLDGPATGEGPDRAPVGPAKLFMDGSDRCAVCLSAPQVAQAVGIVVGRTISGGGLSAIRNALRVLQPPRLSRSLHVHQGLRFWEREALRDTVRSAGERGFQVAQHAIGNEAIDVALDALEHAGGALDGRPGRPRIEHFCMADEQLIRRAADVGAIAVVHPYWVYDTGDMMGAYPYPLRIIPLASLRDAGIQLAGASDFPVAGYDVLAAVRSAVERRTAGGATRDPDEALTVEQALEAYTAGSAAALGVEDEAGRVRSGMAADLVHLDADPVAADPEALDEISVRTTWVGGRRTDH